MSPAIVDVPAAVRTAALRYKLQSTFGGLPPAMPRPGEIAADPAMFLHQVLGCEPWAKQVEMAEAVRDYERVAVCSCNGGGKDWLTGRLVLWWLAAYRPAKCVVVAPTYRQVASIVWAEARQAYLASKIPLGGGMLETPHWKLADDHFAIGFSTDRPTNIQGFHSPNLLVIVSEAHGVEQKYVDALKTFHPSRLLLTGNPFCSAGEFYDAFHSNAELYHGITFSAFETPNLVEGRVAIPGMVTQRHVDIARQEWGEGNPMYVASIRGQFPDSLEDSLIARSWLDVALRANFELSEPRMLALDVARGGADKTVLARRDGKVAKLVWKSSGGDLMATVGWVGRYLDDNSELGRTVVVDDVGVGGGVTDRLRELGYQVAAFQGGAKAADDKRYANATTEAWHLMAEALRKGELALENDPELVAQLSSRRARIQSDRRLLLESKEDLKAKGGKSPDCGDALAMTFAQYARPRIWV